MVVVLVHRSVQVYDYLSKELLFKIDVPYAQPSSIGQKGVIWADNDDILIV
jgi:hypothetical protein